MSNRQSRRATKATDELPPLPKIPNMSGTDECCGNCPKRANEKALKIGRHLQRLPAIPEDEVICLATPGGGTMMKRWGWCSLWGEPNVIKVAQQ